MSAATSGLLPLQARIRAAEQAVVERDLRVRELGLAWIARAKSGGLRALVIGSGVALLGALAGYWAYARRSRKRQPLPAGGDERAYGRRRHGLLDWPWLRILAVAWPLLPLSLRSHVHPAIASLFLGIGGPGAQPAERPADDPGQPAPPATVPKVDLRRYVGQWFEIARLPQRNQARCVADVSAVYALQQGGIAISNQCLGGDGRVHTTQGIGKPVPGSRGARLRLSFAPAWMRRAPWVWTDYWVLDIDDDYRYALVGTPDRSGLWLLSRTPTLGEAEQQRLFERAEVLGYDTALLVRTPQRTIGTGLAAQTP